MERIGVFKIATENCFSLLWILGGGLSSITASLHSDPLVSTEVEQVEHSMILSFSRCCHTDAILGTPTGDSGGTSREGIVEL